jgi:hypothetical protein
MEYTVARSGPDDEIRTTATLEFIGTNNLKDF